MIKHFKKYQSLILILITPAIFVLCYLYLLSPPKTEAEIKGDKIVVEYQYFTNEDRLEIQKNHDMLSENINKANGDVNKQKEAMMEFETKEREFSQQLFSKNQKKFTEYSKKIDSLEESNSSLWKDEKFLRNYFLFQTHVENNRFSEAERVLISLEEQLGIILH